MTTMKSYAGLSGGEEPIIDPELAGQVVRQQWDRNIKEMISQEQ